MDNKDKSLRQFIDDSFNEIKEDIIEMAKDITSIKSALGGNEFGSNGIIKKQAQTENRLTRLEKFYWKSIGALFVINILIIIFFQLIIK